MKKEWVLLFTVTVLTLLISLGLIRWFAPGLLGVPVDMQLVRSAREVPPFYDGVFRQEDLNSKKFLLNDPHTLVRAKPLFQEGQGMGPNDILGFRNRYVPNTADIVVIGDSQTYGNNAFLEQNWPGQLKHMLGGTSSLYSMAAGGWGAVQYLDMFTNATVFRPRVVIVAIYTGNDPLDSFNMVYGVEGWSHLMPDKGLSKADAPNVVFPAPKSEWWPVEFADGVKTTFTPTLRLHSNMEHQAVKAGYDIIADVARRITAIAQPSGIKLVFTIIPTKELVYARKVEQEGLDAPQAYNELVKRESMNIKQLAKKLGDLKYARYIDLVEPFQQTALEAVALYPENNNGHPLSTGYNVIARSLYQFVDGILPEQPRGLYALQVEKDKYQIILVKEEGVWVFTSEEIIEANGWPPGRVQGLEYRQIAHLPRMGKISEVDRKKYGPEALR